MKAFPSDMKDCFKCGAEKPLSEFYKHPSMADGHVNKCKVCYKRDVYENRQKKEDYYRQYDRNRPNSEERNIKNKERNKRKYEEDDGYRESVIRSKMKWEAKNRDKRKAQWAVSNAKRDGKIVQPEICEHCHTTEKSIEAHHWSYEPEHWLDVIWLCTTCHGEEHKRLNELGRDPDKEQGTPL